MYAPRVVFFKNDRGFYRPPIEVDVVTAAAVNAKEVRDTVRATGDDDSDDDDSDSNVLHDTDASGVEEDPLEVAEKKIQGEMFDRMGRILRVFEMHGIRHIVLGGFGTGVCQNSVDLVTSHWKTLLVGDKARFGNSFDTVLMPALGAHLTAVWEEAFRDSASRFPDEVQSDDEGTPPHRASDGGADQDLL